MPDYYAMLFFFAVLGVVALVVLRFIVLWYFKLDRIAANLEAQTELLKQIRDRLP